ncbi:MAG: NUDIX domain-containing protein, partial [Candidatus Bathyanammoxibius sp.]
ECQQELNGGSTLRKSGVWIDDELYTTIKSVIPILCVDMLIRDADGRVLLGKRTNAPAKGEWWIPGGRVLVWETLVSAVHRKALQELAVDVAIDSVVGTYDNIFPGESHMVTVVHACHLGSGALRTDDQHSEYRWFTSLELLGLGLHSLITTELLDGGVY